MKWYHFCEGFAGHTHLAHYPPPRPPPRTAWPLPRQARREPAATQPPASTPARRPQHHQPEHQPARRALHGSLRPRFHGCSPPVGSDAADGTSYLPWLLVPPLLGHKEGPSQTLQRIAGGRVIVQHPPFGPPPRTSPPASPQTGPDETIVTIQKALKILGYDVAADGAVNDKTKEAFARYQSSKDHPRTEAGIRLSLLSLAVDVLNRQPPSPDALPYGPKTQMWRT